MSMSEESSELHDKILVNSDRPGSYIERNRQTGRTARLLQDAISRASSGEEVLVIGRTESDAAHLADLCSELLGGMALMRFCRMTIAPHKGYKIAVGRKGGFVIFSGSTNVLWDWDSMECRGSTINVLVDHAAIEFKYRKLIEMYHRYDEVERKSCIVQ